MVCWEDGSAKERRGLVFRVYKRWSTTFNRWRDGEKQRLEDCLDHLPGPLSELELRKTVMRPRSGAALGSLVFPPKFSIHHHRSVRIEGPEFRFHT